MPLTTFTSDNVRVSPVSFPQVKLEAFGKARIVCAEQGPVFEWVHELKRPVLGKLDGLPVMESRTRMNGETYSTNKMDFIGRSICLGDPDILADRGIDERCPACQLASDSPDTRLSPIRRYAIHVLQYATEQGTTKVLEPYQVATKVWVLTENRYATLVELLEEADFDDPRKIDLLLDLGREPVHYQKYSIKAGGSCEMLKSPERVRLSMETYRANHAPDLSPFCGRKASHAYLSEDCAKIEEAWALVRRAEATGTGVVTPPELAAETVGLDSSLLDSVGLGASPRAVAAPEGSSVGYSDEGALDAFVADTTQPPAPDAGSPVEAEQVPTAEPEQAPTAEEKRTPVPTAAPPVPADFEELLASLGVAP